MKKLTLALVCMCLAAPFAAAEIPEKFNFDQIEGKLGTQPKKTRTISPRKITPKQNPRSAIARNVFGRIRFVNALEDYTVEVVSSPGWEDLRVKIVAGGANRCGEWEIVNGAEDFKIRIVNAGADFKVRFVDAFPGVD